MALGAVETLRRTAEQMKIAQALTQEGKTGEALRVVTKVAAELTDEVRKLGTEFAKLG